MSNLNSLSSKRLFDQYQILEPDKRQQIIPSTQEINFYNWGWKLLQKLSFSMSLHIAGFKNIGKKR